MQTSPKQAAATAIQWMGDSKPRANLLCLIIMKTIIKRLNLPLLNLSNAIDDILAAIRELIDEDTSAISLPRPRLSVDLLDLVAAEFPETTYGSLEDLLLVCEGFGELDGSIARLSLTRMFWLTMLTCSHFLEPDNAYVVLISATATTVPLDFAFMAGLVVSRFNQKRAHYLTAIAASLGTAIKDSIDERKGLYAILDLLAGFGLKKWQHCKDDTHNIVPLTLLTLCVSAVTRAAHPGQEVERNDAMDIMLEYCHRFVRESCLCDWVAHMPIANPCDRGVGDMDLTPIMQAITFATAFFRRLHCDISCFETRKLGRSVNEAIVERRLDQIDSSHYAFMGGICNIINSVSDPSVYFTQLLRTAYVIGMQASANDDRSYIGEHWNFTVSCLEIFTTACRLYLPHIRSELWANVNKLTLPLPSVTAAVIYSLSDYCQTVRDDVLRLQTLQGLKAILCEKFDKENTMELFAEMFHHLLVDYKTGPVQMSALSYAIDMYRRECCRQTLWKVSYGHRNWWDIVQPILDLIAKDSIKLFWTGVIRSLAILVQQACLEHAASQTQLDWVEGTISSLRIEVLGAKPDQQSDINSAIWQLEQISTIALP